MSRNRIFFAFASILLCIATFISLTPSLVNPDLIQPQRIDSMFIQFQRMQIYNEQVTNFVSIDSTIFFNPEDLGMILNKIDAELNGLF